MQAEIAVDIQLKYSPNISPDYRFCQGKKLQPEKIVVHPDNTPEVAKCPASVENFLP